DRVLVERKGFAFMVDFDYENLPDFCSNCNILGHSIHNCKKLISIEDEKQDKNSKDRRQPQKESKKIYVRSKDERAGKGKTTEVAEKDDTIVTNDVDAAKVVHNEKLDEVIVVEEQPSSGHTTVSKHQKIDNPQVSASESNNSQKMAQAQISTSEGFKSQKNDQPQVSASVRNKSQTNLTNQNRFEALVDQNLEDKDSEETQ
ncbi:pre-mRNA-processing factor, partial [Trifolium medium]|nr:pre-mRNA-processing factor [Trifolium medium]